MQMTNNDENFIAFCNELRAYVEEHHHFPNKHANLLSRVKYTRKKINEGKLEEWKVAQFSIMDCSALLHAHLSDVTQGNNKLGARFWIMG